MNGYGVQLLYGSCRDGEEIGLEAEKLDEDAYPAELGNLG